MCLTVGCSTYKAQWSLDGVAGHSKEWPFYLPKIDYKIDKTPTLAIAGVKIFLIGLQKTHKDVKLEKRRKVVGFNDENSVFF
ncbi:hypothetical protein AN634_04135 [Lactiplantibacillus plantarum]|nr:hypothetical protein AN634_04135 [Lactiplantibacillus plantarum]